MGYRRFVDRDGAAWLVRDVSRSTWRFEPDSGGRGVDVPAPGYQQDPFELSTEELQKLLDAVRGPDAPAPRRKPSPFGDG